MASQQNTDAWWNWATGVLHGIGAPTSSENYRSLWNWSIKESGQDPINNGSIHNNPLNTTQRVPGSTSQNSVGVQSFPDVTSGISATIQTLTNGRYPQIVADLKGGVPSGLWANPSYTGLNPSTTAAELKTWGSGTNWLGWNNTPPTPSQNFQNATGITGAGANVTPAARSVTMAQSVAPKPTPKPRSPPAQSSVAAAKAGRGSKLSPDVKTELRGRTE